MELGFDKLPWYGQIATFLLLAVAGYLVFHFYWIVPLGDATSLDREELAELQLEIDQAVRAAGGLRDVEVEVSELTARREGLREALPQERDAPEILRRLQTLAAQSNLSIRAFTPQAIEPGEGYAAWPIRLELNGLYHDLGSFFDRVSKSSQVITINGVIVRAIEPPQLNATISAECTATTFVLNDDALEEQTTGSAL